MTKPLTRQQRGALVALSAGDDLTPGELAARLSTSKEGAVRTASSLVRRGLAVRPVREPLRVGGRKPAAYRITARGLDHLRTEQLELVE